MDYENDEDEFLENAERQAKRTYLREEIIDKGFSAQEFTTFCEQDRGTDVDLWTFEELQDCVKRFKASVEERDKQLAQKMRGRSPSPSSPRPSAPNPIHVKESPEEEVQRTVLVEVQTSPLDSPRAIMPVLESPRSLKPAQPLLMADLPREPLNVGNASGDSSPLGMFTSPELPPSQPVPPMLTSDPAPFLSSPGYSIASKQLPDTPLSTTSSPLHVQIEKYHLPSHELIPGSLLHPSYITYSLRTEPLGWYTRRRFNDFFWLRRVLIMQFPACYVPPIPKKQKRGRLADETILKRRKLLGRFISSVISNPIFLRSQYLVEFLKDTAGEQFLSVKKTATRLKKPEKVEDFASLEGFSACSDSIAADYFLSCGEYLNQAEVLQKRLKRQAHSLMEALRTVSAQTEAMADTYKALAGISCPVETSSKDTYAANAAAFLQWSTYELRLGEAVYEHFTTFYKYRSQELAVLKELLRERETLLITYQKTEEKLQNRKEKLWSHNDVSKWDIDPELHLDTSLVSSNKDASFSVMLHRDSSQLQRSRLLFAYHNYQAKIELQRVLTVAQQAEKTNWQEFAKRQSELLQALSAR